MDAAIAQKVESAIKEMTLEEKVSFCSGEDFWHTKSIERLGIPNIMVADGPHGLRKETNTGSHAGLNESAPATCFPTAAGLASTWNRSLLRQVGEALADECLQEGISVLLGPAINIKRSPLGGRNFEYFSEDPYLTGELATAMVHGIQSRGIGACVKHFAVNNQEKNRMTVDALVDERALREIYLAAFETVVKAACPQTMMCSYNKVNGTYASENKRLLTGILRDEWGFDGVVMSDWGAVNNRVQGLEAGLDLEMPGNGGINDKLILSAVKNGHIREDVVNTAVRRLLKLIFEADAAKQKGFYSEWENHHMLARTAAAECFVLLKNEGNVLPLNPGKTVALLGEFATQPRYQGGGSSLVNPLQLDNAYDSATAIFGDRILFARGYDNSKGTTDNALLTEASGMAAQADVAIILAGLTDEMESEGYDRTHLCLPESHTALIQAVSQTAKKTLVVLFNGAPVEMPWIRDVDAVLEAHLPGQAGGSALWDVLLGDINPSGRLAETFPLKLEDNPSAPYFPMGPAAVEYRESIYVGYRYYDTAKADVLFPFGYGLSYTSFHYSDMTVSADTLQKDKPLTVTVTIKNTGTRAGMEVVQLYVAHPGSTVHRPEKELKGFEKVSLEAGEEKTVIFTLNRRAFSTYNVAAADWNVSGGEYLIMVGSSSRDIHCTAKLTLTSGPDSADHAIAAGAPPAYGNITPPWRVNRQDFASLPGIHLTEKAYSPKPYNRNSTLEEVKDNIVGKLLYNKVIEQATKSAQSNEQQLQMIKTVVNGLPLRGLVTMSNGAMSYQLIDALIHLMNKKFFHGITLLMKGLAKKSSSSLSEKK